MTTRENLTSKLVYFAWHQIHTSNRHSVNTGYKFHRDIRVEVLCGKRSGLFPSYYKLRVNKILELTYVLCLSRFRLSCKWLH